MINIDFSGTDLHIIELVESKTEAIAPAVATKLDELDAEMVSFIVGDELHGQILNQRSGKLAGSIRALPANQEGTSIVGQVEGGGGATGIQDGKSSYAELFEYGTTVTIVPVKAQALRFETLAGEVLFRKKVVLPLPRPFMAPAFAKYTPIIIAGVEEAISEVLDSYGGA